MKKIFIVLFALLISIDVFAHDTDIYIANGEGVEQNILIIFDNSNSMADEIQVSFYNPSSTYPGSKTSGTVYYLRNNNWNNVLPFQVGCSNAITALLTTGFYSGRVSSTGCSGQNYSLRTGNYINYLNSIGGDEYKTKLEIAKQIIKDLIDSISGVRVGIMDFNRIVSGSGPTYFYGQDAKGGKIVKQINTLGSPGSSARTDLKNAITGINAESGTPLAESLYEAGLYFKGASSYFNPGTNYISPIQYHCQTNYVIIVTDGDSTVDNDPILNTIGDQDGDGHDPGGSNPYHYLIGGVDQLGTDYLDDVAKYLYTSDLRTDMEGLQNIVTYTIGFQVDSQHQLLQRTATNGHGKYYYTQTVQNLADAFQNIIDQILTKTSSFVAPIVPVSRMERELSGDKVYLALFKPLRDITWSGNIKKYNISSDGTILDVNLNPALDPNGTFLELSKSLWSSVVDGNDVEKGGAGEKLLTRSSARNIFTYMGTDSNLVSASNQFSLSNSLITPVTLNFSAGENQNRDDLIRFVHGFDPYNGRPDGKREWILGSFLHSKPVVVRYEAENSLIFAGSNDGMLHAFDDESGEEIWSFIPNSLLNKLQMLRTDQIQIFVDGSPRVFLGASQKILIFGLRRGGNRYIALDITNRTSPKFLWEISPSTPGFSELGQTWSSPSITKIKYGTGEKWVFIVGAGYDENQDNDTITLPDSKGRGIYVIDIVSGCLVWKYTVAENPSMTYSIPADVTKVDSDSDGKTDRIYVGDMGGKIWRIDLSESGLTGRVIFDSGKKMFYSPDVTLESDEALYEMLYFGTGDREHPKENVTINWMYAVKDKSLSRTLTETDLVDVTTDRIQIGSDSERTNIATQLKNGSGWYIKLDQNLGEKSLSQPVVFSKTVYFTTFSPVAGSQTDACFVGEGVARIYIMDYKNGSSVFDFDLNETLNRSDRSKVIGTSIPSSVVIALKVDGVASAYIGVGGGIISAPLKKNKTLVPISWRRMF